MPRANRVVLLYDGDDDQGIGTERGDWASNGGMSTTGKTNDHTEGADQMARWKRGVRRTAVMVIMALALCSGIGYLSSIYAQSRAEQQENAAIQEAVDHSRIEALAGDEGKILSRLDAIDVRQAVMSDRLSQMVGIGIGGMGVLSVLSALGIGLHLRRSKPGS